MPQATMASSEIWRATLSTLLVVKNLDEAKLSATNIISAATRIPSSRIRLIVRTLLARGAWLEVSIDGWDRTLPAILSSDSDHRAGHELIGAGDHPHDLFAGRLAAMADTDAP